MLSIMEDDLWQLAIRRFGKNDRFGHEKEGLSRESTEGSKQKGSGTTCGKSFLKSSIS